MNTTTRQSFDPTWERDIYGAGKHLNRYPFDVVVSFVYRHYPRNKPRNEVRIVEVGCGAANNLWFAAREGFQVAGIDASESAIAFARKRFEEEGLQGDLRVGDFTSLPYPDNWADLAVDRGGITCCGRSAAAETIAEVRRVLTPGGRFLFNGYSSAHTSASMGKPGADGVTVDIAGGTLTGVGQICFYSNANLDEVFADGWKIIHREHLELVEHGSANPTVHAEWRVVAEKV